jgi:cytochrome P450
MNGMQSSGTVRRVTSVAIDEKSADGSERFPPGPPLRKGIVPSLRYYWGFATDPIGFVRGRFESYGDIYYVPNSDGGLFVLRHPDHLREVLATRASSFGKQHSAFTQLSRVLGEGLLISEGDTWTRQRRMLAPGFAPPRMRAYGDIMVDEARRTANRWSDGTTVALEREMTELTLRIVSRTLFGHDVSKEDTRAIARAMSSFQGSLSSPDLLPAWVPLPGRRELAHSLAELDRIVYRLIRERRAAGASHAERPDLLQLLVDAVDPEAKADTTASAARLSEREVRDQLVTFFLAGHETTSQALTWAFYCLSQTPAAERALHAELESVLGDREPTFDDLERLPYTEQVMLEAMRLYPPVYAIARRAREDTEVGGYRVPRGSEVMIWVYMTHRDERFYPEPEAFRPERFEKEKLAALPKLAYLPFGAGPRACIGKSFAIMEARLILATLAQRYRLSLARGKRVVPRPQITLVPKNGIQMKVAGRRRSQLSSGQRHASSTK